MITKMGWTGRGFAIAHSVELTSGAVPNRGIPPLHFSVWGTCVRATPRKDHGSKQCELARL